MLLVEHFKAHPAQPAVPADFQSRPLADETKITFSVGTAKMRAANVHQSCEIRSERKCKSVGIVPTQRVLQICVWVNEINESSLERVLDRAELKRSEDW